MTRFPADTIGVGVRGVQKWNGSGAARRLVALIRCERWGRFSSGCFYTEFLDGFMESRFHMGAVI